MRKIITSFLCVLSFSCFAVSHPIIQYTNGPPDICAKVLPISANFCPKFKEIAQCHCIHDGGLPAGMCQDMNTIHKRMLAAFGSQEGACKWQEQHGTPAKTSYQECMDDWNCYRLGGAQGGLVCRSEDTAHPENIGKKCE